MLTEDFWLGSPGRGTVHGDLVSAAISLISMFQAVETPLIPMERFLDATVRRFAIFLPRLGVSRFRIGYVRKEKGPLW